MIFLESLALCLIAAAVGIGLASWQAGVLLVPAISSFLVPAYSLEVFVRAVAVGVVRRADGRAVSGDPGSPSVPDGGTPI